MIYTLTLNPCIDKTVCVGELRRGELNRVTSARRDPAGKGINVSRILQSLAVESVPMGFLAGAAGRFIHESMTVMGLRPEFVWIPGETRTNLKVMETGGVLTEINESGPPAGATDLAELMGKLGVALQVGDWLVASGSLPPGVPESVYRDLVVLARSKGAKCLIDADDEPMRLALGTVPAMMKPNLFELGKLMGRTIDGVGEACLAGRELAALGVGLVIISMGAGGALLVDGDSAVHAWSAPIRLGSPVGCGDTLAAAALWGLSRHLALGEIARCAVGAATAKAMKPGTLLPSREEMLAGAGRVTVRNVE